MTEAPYVAILRAVDRAICKAAEDIDSFDGETHWVEGSTGEFVPAAAVAVLRTLTEKVRLPDAVEEYLDLLAAQIETEEKLPRRDDE
jgi:hypothetical protein